MIDLSVSSACIEGPQVHPRDFSASVFPWKRERMRLEHQSANPDVAAQGEGERIKNPSVVVKCDM